MLTICVYPHELSLIQLERSETHGGNPSLTLTRKLILSIKMDNSAMVHFLFRSTHRTPPQLSSKHNACKWAKEFATYFPFILVSRKPWYIMEPRFNDGFKFTIPTSVVGNHPMGQILMVHSCEESVFQHIIGKSTLAVAIVRDNPQYSTC